jgi:uncharacterized membrane protein YbaN (DUF454 family)
MVHRGLARVVYFAAATVCLILGAVGVFIPVLPTTPFLLLAAALYLRSSERMHAWMFENRFFGEYLRNYRDGKGIPLGSKLVTIAALWATIAYSALFVSTHWAMSLALIVIAVAVTIHLLLIPTLRKKD